MKGKAKNKADWATTAKGEKIHLPTYRKQHKLSEYKEEVMLPDGQEGKEGNSNT